MYCINNWLNSSWIDDVWWCLTEVTRNLSRSKIRVVKNWLYTYLRIWQWQSTTRIRHYSLSWRTSAGRSVTNPQSSRPCLPRCNCPWYKAGCWRILCCPSARRTSSPFEASSPRWNRPSAGPSDPLASTRRSQVASSRTQRSTVPSGSWSRWCAWIYNHWCLLLLRADSGTK